MITDEMVEWAAKAAYEAFRGHFIEDSHGFDRRHIAWNHVAAATATKWRTIARAALEAALSGKDRPDD